MEETINMQGLLKIVKKRIVLIVFITVIAIAMSGIMSFLVLTPIYKASTQILVNQTAEDAGGQISAQDIQTNLQLINTYSGIIKSPVILSKVIEELDLDMTSTALNGAVSVNIVQNSQILSIDVQSSDPSKAVDIANTVATVFQKEIKTLMNMDNIIILAPAEKVENPSPISPNSKLNMAIAAVIGLMIGIGLVFLLEFLDTTMKTEQDIEDVLGIPILGIVSPIPDIDLKASETEFIKNRRKNT